MKKQEKYAVVVQESVVGSIIKDIVTFGMFAGLMYFNHQVLSGNGWIDMAFIMFVFLWLLGRSSKNVFKGTIKDAIKWLESKEA